MALNKYVKKTLVKRVTPPENVLLIDKHRPKKSTDVVVDDITRLLILKWIQAYKNRDNTIKKCMILAGPVGIGKATLARLLLEENGYDVCELNASHQRSKKEMMGYLEDYNLVSVTGKPKVLLILNLDAYNNNDNGAISEVIRYINPLRGGTKRPSLKEKQEFNKTYWKIPIVCVCNKHGYGKINDLIKESYLVTFKKPSKNALIRYFSKIVDPGVIDIPKVISDSRGDVIQIFASLSLGGSISKKDRNFDVLSAMNILLRHVPGPDMTTALRLYSVDTSIIPMMIFENYLDTTNSLEDAIAASESISYSDIVETKMYSTQSWDMFGIFGIFGTVYPASIARKNTTQEMRFGNLWSKMSSISVKTKTIQEIISRIAEKHGFVDNDYLLVLREFLFSRIHEPDFVQMCVSEYNLDIDSFASLMKISTFGKIKNAYNTNLHTSMKKRWAYLF